MEFPEVEQTSWFGGIWKNWIHVRCDVNQSTAREIWITLLVWRHPKWFFIRDNKVCGSVLSPWGWISTDGQYLLYPSPQADRDIQFYVPRAKVWWFFCLGMCGCWLLSNTDSKFRIGFDKRAEGAGLTPSACWWGICLGFTLRFIYCIISNCLIACFTLTWIPDESYRSDWLGRNQMLSKFGHCCPFSFFTQTPCFSRAEIPPSLCLGFCNSTGFKGICRLIWSWVEFLPALKEITLQIKFLKLRVP